MSDLMTSPGNYPAQLLRGYEPTARLNLFHIN